MPTQEQLYNRSNPQAFTFKMPGEGETFRQLGDTNGDAVYKIANGKITTVASPSYIANTSFVDKSTGTSYKAGDITPSTRNLQWLDPNYRGLAASRTNAYSAYKAQTGSDAMSLPEYNMAGIQSVLERGGAFGTSATFNGPEVGADVQRQLVDIARAQAQAPQTPQPQLGQSSAFPTQALQPGTKGDQVLALQKYLVSQGLLTQAQMDTGPGIYGPQTTAAVAALQANLGVDNSGGVGFFGPKTLEKLKSGAQGAGPQMSQQGMMGGASSSPMQPSMGGASSGPMPPSTGSDAYFQQLMQQMQPSSQEEALQQQLGGITGQQANINASRDLGIQGVNEQPIATPFLTGQSAAITNRAAVQSGALGAQAVPLQQQLALAQAKRQASIDISKEALNYNQQKEASAAAASQTAFEQGLANRRLAQDQSQFSSQMALNKQKLSQDGTANNVTYNGVALTTSQITAVDQVDTVLKSLSDYKTLYTDLTSSTYGGINLSGEDAAQLRASYNALMFQIAQAAGTGALQEADREIVQGMLPDPTSFKAALGGALRGGKEGGIKAIDEVSKIMQNKKDAILKTSTGAPATGGSNPLGI